MSKIYRTPNNLEDMISFIEDLRLIEPFFKHYAPDFPFDWKAAEASPTQRARLLRTCLENHRADSAAHAAQYEELFLQLRTVAMVNAESESCPLTDMIERHPGLSDFYKNALTFTFKPESANLAVFINLVAHQILPKTPHDIALEAERLEKELLARITNDLFNAKTSVSTAFKPKALSSQEAADALRAFEDELRLALLPRFGSERFYVAVHVNPTGEWMHYVVTTSPVPHRVLVVNDQQSATEARPDNHAKTFEIIVDTLHCRIRATKTNLIASQLLVQMFIRDALRSVPVARQRLSYTEALKVFTRRDSLVSLPLPQKDARHGARVWIESLDIQLREEDLPVTFHGDALHDIYNEIDRLAPQTLFPWADWIVQEAVLRIELPATVTHPTKAYEVKITERTFTVPEINRVFDREHLATLSGLQSAWHFEGLSTSQQAIGKVA